MCSTKRRRESSAPAEEEKRKVRVECRGFGSCALDDLEPFQGGLKSITRENAEALKRNIARNGFSSPFFVWRNGKRRMLLDGHQRLRALLELRREGWEVGPLPYAEVDAADECEAKRKLLAIASQFGDFEREEAARVLGLAGGDGIADELRLPPGAMSEESVRMPDEAKSVDRFELARKCRKCGYEF
jgi:hypothetical protein